MTHVIIRNLSYEETMIQRCVDEMLDSMGPQWITPGMRVLVKPNLLLPAPPERAIVTHPLICRAVVKYLLKKEAQVQVSDSPGIGLFHKLIRETGYQDALSDLDVDLKPFETSVEVDIGHPFGKIPIAKEAVEADRVINLAKLKTHAHMYLTLSIKNIFGCIVGMRKPEWHMRAGVDRMLFARLLVQIYQTVAPDFTILDGILALEGQGPGKSGTPRELGLVLGGADGHAIDRTVCTIFGLDPNQLLTHLCAREMGICADEIHVNGNLQIIDDFHFPELHALSLGPESLSRFMRKYVIQRPVINKKICKICGECWKICPAKAIAHDVKGVHIAMEKCIRCYCCIEVCPHAAIVAKEPIFGRFWRRFIKPVQAPPSIEDDACPTHQDIV